MENKKNTTAVFNTTTVIIILLLNSPPPPTDLLFVDYIIMINTIRSLLCIYNRLNASFFHVGKRREVG